MGFTSIWHWLVVLLIVLVLFGGAGKLSRLMGDAGKGIKAFKKGLNDKDEDPAEEATETKRIEDGVEATDSKKDETKA